MEDDKKKRQMPQKSVLTIRFLVGCYLLYTDYSLIEGVKTRQGGERILIIFFMVLFFAAGVFLMIYSGKLLWEDWKREKEERQGLFSQSSPVKQETAPKEAAVVEEEGKEGIPEAAETEQIGESSEEERSVGES